MMLRAYKELPWYLIIKFFDLNMKGWDKHCHNRPTGFIDCDDLEAIEARREEIRPSYEEFHTESVALLNQLKWERVMESRDW